MQGKIFFIVWVSWAWKWTLIENLRNIWDNRFYFPLSYKSRQIRETEKNWVDAWFISNEEFEKSIYNWEFLEYAKVYWLESYYWAKYSDLIDNWINKWKIVIKEVDMEWLLILKNQRPELDSFYKSIFLTIPLDLQIERIKSRWATMSEKELEERRKTAKKEIKEAQKYCDYIIDTWNKTKEEVLAEAVEIIKKW